MPLRSDWSDALCPIARSLDTLGDPWALLIIRDVVSGTRRSTTSAPTWASPTAS